MRPLGFIMGTLGGMGPGVHAEAAGGLAPQALGGATWINWVNVYRAADEEEDAPPVGGGETPCKPGTSGARRSRLGGGGPASVP